MVRHTDTTTGDRIEATTDETVDAHDLAEGDRVEVKAVPMGADEAGRVTGEVVESTIHTMNGDEVSQSVKVRSDTGTLYVRNGTGTLSVVDDDGFHATIARDSTLRREPATDGGDDIIVAGDEGVIIDGKCGERGPNGERCKRDDGHAGPHAAGFPADAARRPDPEPRHVWGDNDAHPDDEGVEILSDGGTDTYHVTLTVMHGGGKEVVRLTEHESGFIGLLIASSANRIKNPDVDDDRVDGVYDALMSPLEAGADPDIRTDGGKPPGEDVSVAANYRDGGVWFTLGNNPRRLLSPDDARAIAEEVEDTFLSTPPGYDEVTDLAEKLRELADEVEAKCDDPNPDAHHDIPLTDRRGL